MRLMKQVDRPDRMGSDFWARRKAAVAAEEAKLQRTASAAVEIADDDPEDGGPSATPADEHDDARVLAGLGLPDPESLGPGDEFAPFMQDVVPERIRIRALRSLWRSNPALANLDGLIDYGENFTDAACVLDNLQTAYQVGKGMRAHVKALAAKVANAPGQGSDVAEDMARPAPDLPDADDAAGGDASTMQETSGPKEEGNQSEAHDTPQGEVEEHAHEAGQNPGNTMTGGAGSSGEANPDHGDNLHPQVPGRDGAGERETGQDAAAAAPPSPSPPHMRFHFG